MKRGFYALIVFCLVFAYRVSAQKHSNRDCGENGFDTEVVKAELNQNGCIDYTLKVTFEKGKCLHALSHYTVAVSCGKVSNVTNSQNWKIEYGYDRTTGLTGFKVDGIPNFGETSLQSFTVSFTVCQDGNKKCATSEGCCYPIVAYKAATCIYYDKLKDSCPSPEPPASDLKASLTKTDILCNGSNNGSLTVTVAEGKEPYTYSWSTGATTSSIDNLTPGNYSVTVKDASGKELTLEGVIGQPQKIELSATITNENCGGKNGAVNLTATGGTGIYAFIWSNGATTEDINALAAGTYTLTVKDENGCEANSTFMITDQASLTITASIIMAGCGQTNGALDVVVSGGTEPYSYQWSNGAITQDLQNLGPGTYRVTIKDANGCVAESAFAIKENNTLKLTYAVTQTSCLDDASGAIDLIVTGGTAPYTYVWSNNATTQDISGLTYGFYTATVTDAAGCTSSVRISVTKKSFQVSEQVVQPACDNSQGGSVTLNPVNGVEPYTYVWSNGATTNTIDGLTPDIYTVKVTDATGCSRDLAYVISDATGISSSASVTNDQCNAQGHFNIDVTVSGGQGPYTYKWSNGATTEDLTGVQSGNYTVTITDANGCSTVKDVQVVGESTWACLINQPASEVLCSSAANGLNTAVTGADTYFWSVESSDGEWAITGGESTSSIVYTAGGVNSSAAFTLTITKDGCTQTCEYELAACRDESDTTPPTDPGGDDDGDDDGGDDGDGDDDGDNDGGDGDDDDNNASCEDCFESQIAKVSTDGSCRTYEVKVSTDGTCRHDLSHWTIAMPCGTVSNYTNSENWKMEFGQDPTTGVYGLKVDGISGFGGTNDHFTVRFTICYDNYECKEKLNDWNPVVAYKAGQCVAHDTLGVDDDHYDDENDEPVCKTYPNPFREKVCFEWKADRDEDACIEIFDTQGHHVKDVFRGRVNKGEHYKVECADLDGSMYIYRFRSGKKTTQGKICKSR